MTDHAELRRLAERLLRGERPDHTLAPTDLAHEAWLRLRAAIPADGQDPQRYAARVMRQILVDHSRRRSAGKRNSGRIERLDDPDRLAEERDAYVVALDAALADLAEMDSELAAVVELRFFGGLDIDETALALGVSARTIKRRWQLAKAWLHREITK